MKNGFYLRTYFHGGYDPIGSVYERDLWLKKGLVLTDDGQALIRTPPPTPGVYINPAFLRTIKGETFRLGPWAEERPSEPLPWYPFCVDGKWGIGSSETGKVMVEPQWAFCDCFIENRARFSAKGDFNDLNRECYDGAFGMYDDDLDIFLPPVYQHLSSMQDGMILAKKDGLWGAFLWSRYPELPFEWDSMTFAKSLIVAGKNTARGPRYTLFYQDQRRGRLDVLIDGLTAVTVPTRSRSDGEPFYECRLIERDGRWGVVAGPTANLVQEPALSREDAETLFWEWEEDDDEWP